MPSFKWDGGGEGDSVIYLALAALVAFFANEACTTRHSTTIDVEKNTFFSSCHMFALNITVGGLWRMSFQ